MTRSDFSSVAQGAHQSGLRASSHSEFTFPEPSLAHQWMTRVMAPHRLEVLDRGAAFSTRINRKVLGGTAFNLLTISAPISIEVSQSSRYIIQVPLNGVIRSIINGKPHGCKPGSALLFSPRDHRVMSWSRNTQALVIQFPGLAMDAQFAALYGRTKESDPSLAPAIDGEQPSGRAILGMIDQIRDALENDVFASTCIAQEYERMLMVLTVTAQHRDGEDRHLPARPYYVVRAERFMRENLESDIALCDIVAASGVSERSLQAGFQRVYKTTPLRHLKTLRLEGAHRTLLEGMTGETRVSDIAMRFNFCQLGRFSADYKQAYGRLPSETLLARQQVRRTESGTA